MTCIDGQYRRHNRAIACQHFKNPHSSQRIRELVHKVYNEIIPAHCEIVGTVTDNGSNMLGAFFADPKSIRARTAAAAATVQGESEALIEQFTEPPFDGVAAMFGVEVAEVHKEIQMLGQNLAGHDR